MKHVFTIALSLLIANFSAQSSLGTIKGKVVSEKDNEPVINAQVYVMVNSHKVGASSDIYGNFTINALPSGTYDIVVSSIEYDSAKVQGFIVNADQFNFVSDIKLTQNGTIMDDVIVEAPIKLIDKGASGTRINISSAEIKRSPVKFDINKLAMTSGAVSSTGDGQEIYFRGSRSGDVIYMVDGIKIMGVAPKLPAASIQSMSVYTGGLPAKFGDTMGGVIAVETKSYFDMYYESLRNQ
jgi:hypothetical protein